MTYLMFDLLDVVILYGPYQQIMLKNIAQKICLLAHKCFPPFLLLKIKTKLYQNNINF